MKISDDTNPSAKSICAGASVHQHPAHHAFANSCICMRVYVCVNTSNVTRARASRCHMASPPPPPLSPACCERPHGAGRRGETLSAAHPGEEGLPARLLSHHLGPCACDCLAPDPLGSSRCRRTSALCSLLVKREKQHATEPAHFSLCHAFAQ